MATIRQKGDGWQVQVRRKGYPPATKQFRRRIDAVTWSQKTELSMTMGTYVPPHVHALQKAEADQVAQAATRTLQEAIDKFLSELPAHREKDRRNLSGPLKEWALHLGARPIQSLKSTDVAGVLTALRRKKTVRGRAPTEATLLRKLAALTAALKVARREWGWLSEDPLAGLTKPRAERGRTRYLSDEERDRLLDAARRSECALLFPIVIVALSTGMRLGEIKGMRWRDLSIAGDVPVGNVSLTQTKNNEVRAVPLAGPALTLVRRLNEERIKARRVENGFVFPSTRLKGRTAIDIRAPWELCIKEAKLSNFRFHDLRHSSASYLAMNGATPNEIAEVLGHKTLSMVKRYAHLSPAHTQNLIARVNEKIFKDIKL